MRNFLNRGHKLFTIYWCVLTLPDYAFLKSVLRFCITLGSFLAFILKYYFVERYYHKLHSRTRWCWFKYSHLNLEIFWPFQSQTIAMAAMSILNNKRWIANMTIVFKLMKTISHLICCNDGRHFHSKHLI